MGVKGAAVIQYLKRVGIALISCARYVCVSSTRLKIGRCCAFSRLSFVLSSVRDIEKSYTPRTFIKTRQ